MLRDPKSRALVEEFTGVPVTLIGVGPGRDQIIWTDAAEGTIRKLFAESIEANSVHGSDSPENAAIEIAYFFAGAEIVG